ncbi:MAG: hypothetical protein AAF604_08355 [Acidobacteriota bacterium]
MKTSWPAIFLAVALTSPLLAAPPEFCPSGSAGDWTWTDTSSRAECVFVEKDHGASPSRTSQVHFNFYCPGRMRSVDTMVFGRWIVDQPSARVRHLSPGTGALTGVVRNDFEDAGLEPVFNGISHRHHYDCVTRSGLAGVATHVKVRVLGQPSDAASHIAESCVVQKRSGPVLRGRYLDLDFRCSNHFISGERRLIADVARRLTSRHILEDENFEPDRASVCILPSTNIKCAPCKTSNNLILRTFVSRNRSGADTECAKAIDIVSP